jgi:hypothetical protein
MFTWLLLPLLLLLLLLLLVLTANKPANALLRPFRTHAVAVAAAPAA